MRNKKETDISCYTEKNTDSKISTNKESGVKRFFKGLGKFLFTILSVCFVAFFIAGISLGVYIFTIASEPTGIDLEAKSMNQTSFIMVKDKKTGEFHEYQKLYSTENRVWVDNSKLPEAMKEAIVAIEDKRFYDHNGVDWTRTASAVLSLATGTDSYGGSTLTQQLIKNITDDNEVSLTRKIREICKALNLEKEYTKDQILEAYLNVVNFGNNCQGVEAASQLYFGKSITDCSIAECAAIAGITQNPSLWNPLVYPENNRERRELIIHEMYTQGKITKAEYDEAMAESANMTFVGWQSDDDDDEEDDDDGYVQNWYIDQLYYDLKEDLAQYYNISEDAASDKLYTEGLKIYCAMDEEMQEYIEKEALKIDKSYDPDLQIGSVLMDLDGRVVATVGSSKRKTQALEWDRATHSSLQPGSTIKPVLVYPLAIENKEIYYSSKLDNSQYEKYRFEDGVFKPGPINVDGIYGDNVLLPDAIERSTNCTVVHTMDMIGGPSVVYEQAVTKMGFSMLSEADAVNMGALSIGGMNGGVSVREMAAAYTFMGNSGLYYEPYTYYYVTDSEGNIIIDNRDRIPKQVYSPETAGIMNRLLNYNMNNCAHTNAYLARVSGWDILGKTGTTDYNKDSWFCGLSPYASMATWCGFDDPDTVSNNGRNVAINFFSNIMGKYLDGKETKEFSLPSTLIKAQYNPYTGLIVSTDDLSGKHIGYYTEDNMPSFGGYYDGYPDVTTDPDATENPDATLESGVAGELIDGSVPDASGENPSIDPSAPMEELPSEGGETENPENGEVNTEPPINNEEQTTPVDVVI